MEIPVSFKEFDIVEIRFKGGRKEFFRNINRLPLITGDAVVVDVPNGHHIGHVSLKGELVRLQMNKKKVQNNDEIRSIYRVATEKDMEKFNLAREQEPATMYRARAIVQELKLKMKLSDVEYQADKTKATFFYSADDRVDFRELIKKLAEEFKVRIEMRQISLRHEAGRLGGIGSCGRELCCSTWLTDFRSVSTTAARYQNLSLNPSKLSGQCGRLKCCLNYELETYMDALKDIPNVNRPLQTKAGDAFLQKTDIFRRIMWFGYRGDSNWFPVTVERVHEVLKMNAAGEMPENLAEEVKKQLPEVVDFVEALEGNLDRLDEQYKAKKKRNKKKKNGAAAGAAPTATEVLAQAAPTPEARRDRPSGRAVEGGENKPRPERNGNKPRGNENRQAKPERDPQAKGQQPQGGKPRPERDPNRPERDPNRAPKEGNQGNRPPRQERQERPKGERPPQSNRPQPVAQAAVAGVTAPERTEAGPRPEGEQRSRRSRNRNNRNRKPGNPEGGAPKAEA
ncbi:Signal peptidase-like protein [Rufibacter sp. H-1]|uniref:Signal peptidase-like protein n=2 Tax=Rufibacter sediminis TaxID=2762756 RepID=A0ABR6VNH0_9BACT|nr:regulatory iron-sulfur-containing complex subunit RicT [Rufibacter sediminis]MBC3538440.1 Signal peptidase-like protein [Rufibacter sediminis]